MPDIVIELWNEGHHLEEQARRDLDRAARIRRHAATLARDGVGDAERDCWGDWWRIFV
ncbi:hypothetical protein [Acidipropionibacterium acidipropionici]|uniref:hypothetical protein n=1 Tax=Acidipropionibacterium acidipropionici TaxID=1748 RepID=UPI0012FE01AE|nr:hypothetical protein [Acidipropionibacterium acidipropionici]